MVFHQRRHNKWILPPLPTPLISLSPCKRQPSHLSSSCFMTLNIHAWWSSTWHWRDLVIISQVVAKTYLDSTAKSKYPDAELEKTDTLVHTMLSRTLLSETPPRLNRNLTTNGSPMLMALEHPSDVSKWWQRGAAEWWLTFYQCGSWWFASGLIQASLNIAVSWEVPVL